MDLYHTSPNEITTVTKNGRFGEFLFFSSAEYVMTAGAYVTYSLNIDKYSFIDAGHIFYDESAGILADLVAELADRIGCSESDAESLIDESKSVFDIDCAVEAEDLADAAWDVQHFTARAAKLLGYDGVRVTDEQGTAYMIDMLGRESEIVRI